MEMLVVLFILSVVIGMSVLGFSCYIKSADYKENISNAKLIQTTVLNYASDNDGAYPLDSVGTVDKLVMDSLFDSMGEKFASTLKKDSLYKHFVFSIDDSKINLHNKIQNGKSDDYYIFYVSSDNSMYSKLRTELLNSGAVSADKLESLLKSFNGTIVFKDYMDTCSDGNVANFISGKNIYNDVSEGLKYEISDDFINCPNGGICEKNTVID